VERVGRYQILEEIGRGAIGVVYKALDPAIGRTVAVKTIRLGEVADRSDLQEVKQHLLSEARSAGMLSHPNIVTVYDVLEEGDVAYVVMEYVEGQSLENMLRNRTLSPSADIIRFLRQIAEALDYAHRRGVVHRDIKPANILIANVGRDSDQSAKIADFGVANVVSLEASQASIAGTPNYMSPEQIGGLAVTGRSDQFSLGVIVYEILTGSTPFTAPDFTALRNAIIQQPAKPVEESNPTVSDAVNRVVQRAIAKAPEDRFESATTFIGALSIVLGDCLDWRSPSSPPLDDATRPRIVERPVADGVPTRKTEQQQGRVENTRPIAGATIFADTVQTRKTSSPARKLTLLAALLFALLGVILFIVRMNSGPPIPVQTLDSNSGPVSPPPPQDLSQPQSQPEPATPAPQQPAKPPSAVVKPQTTAHAPTTSAGGTSSSAESAFSPQATADVELLTDPPGAQLTIDSGARSCTSPCTLSLSSGRHTLIAQLAGYAVARRIFNVPQDASLFISLQRGQGVLVVTSDPPGSAVTVDGNPIGYTPVTARLVAGPHQLVISRGSAQHVETVQIEPDAFQARTIRWR
jgi:serine/threonine-protein kinase